MQSRRFIVTRSRERYSREAQLLILAFGQHGNRRRGGFELHHVHRVYARITRRAVGPARILDGATQVLERDIAQRIGADEPADFLDRALARVELAFELFPSLLAEPRATSV